MHPIHIIQSGWWKAPRLSADQERDLAAFVRALGKPYFVVRMRDSDNEVANPFSLVNVESLRSYPAQRLEPTLLSCLFKAIRRSQRDMFLIVAFLTAVIGFPLYEQSLRMALYMGTILGVYLLAYFGDLYRSMRRYWRWLSELEAKHPSNHVTREECQQIILRRCMPSLEQLMKDRAL